MSVFRVILSCGEVKCIKDSKAALDRALEEAANYRYLAGRIPGGGAPARPNPKMNLSAVIAQALARGLRQQTVTERSEILERYQEAFSGFTDDETSLLDGIVLERPSGS